LPMPEEAPVMRIVFLERRRDMEEAMRRGIGWYAGACRERAGRRANDADLKRRVMTEFMKYGGLLAFSLLQYVCDIFPCK